ncbi:Ankyrin-1 [Orbilia brochopaga]|nr:Ankyrin-1 [Drechslerella brochopaga]
MADPLSIAASIIAVVQLSNAVLSYCYRFRSQAKDADKDIAQIITQVEDLWAILTQLQEVIEHEPPSYSPPSGKLAGPADPARAPNALLAQCQKSVKSTEAILESITERLTPLLKGGLLSKLKWPFESKVVQEKLEALQKCKATFQLYLSLQHMKSLDLQSQELTEHKDILSKVQVQSGIARRTSILRWYKTSDPEQNHKVSRSRHDPNTCQWVFELDSFNDWSSAPGKYLWIHGIPGAGKTIICSTIIEHLNTAISEKKSVARVIYYYFDFADTNKLTVESFLQSAIYQLLSTTPGDLPEAATALYDRHSGLQTPSSEELLDVFAELLSANSKTYVVLDAIDECSKEEREKLFNAFLSRFEATGASLLVTSRREPDIEKAFKPAFHHTICIEDSKVDEDVQTHVTKAMASEPAFKNWNAAIKKEVSDAISKGSRGMFRWAVCQLDTMKKCLTPAMIRAELRHMPETLDQTYDRILQNIPSLHQQFVRSALRWLAFSTRPLLLIELAEAAVIDPSMDSFDPAECRFLDPEKILDLCGSLITLSKGKRGMTYGTDDWAHLKRLLEPTHLYTSYESPSDTLTTVALSHYSVKEYLSSERLRNSPLTKYFTSPNSADLILAECSLLYLLNIGQGEILLNKGFREYPLLKYAAVNWMDHCRKAIEEAEKPESSLNNLVLRLFDETIPGPYINWLNSYNPDADAPGTKETVMERFPIFAHKSLEQFPAPLYYAVRLGSVQIVNSLIKRGTTLKNSGKGFFGSPLVVAAFYGHLQIVDTLLQAVGLPESSGEHFGTVLQAAAAGGSCDVVKMLVKAGADVDAVGGTWNTALVAAASHGHHDIVAFLLQSKANLSISSASHGTPLYQAALAGDARTVSKLLQSGAAINQLSKEGTALYAAAASGSLPLVQTLLRQGADVNIGGRGQWGFPLIAAASQGHITIVRALLRAKAKVNAQLTTDLGARGVTALEAAIESRDLLTFQAILDAGGDSNVQGRHYPNGLYAALRTDQLAMARILLERNAEIVDETFIEAIEKWNVDKWFLRTILDRNPNIDAHSGDYGSALHAAIMWADEEAVKLILDRDPYLDAASKYGSPLACALDKRMKGVALELIKRGADISKDYTGNPPFKAAISLACKGAVPDFEIADLLLSKGVDVNCARGAALREAIWSDNIPVIRYLAKHGADLNMHLTSNECTPLQMVAQTRDIPMAEVLLELGADVNGPHGQSGPTLLYALQSKKEPVVRFFLKKGAKIDDSHELHSLLVRAILAGMTTLVKELIEGGADVNKLGSQGWTPLAAAIDKGDEKAENLLRSRGAKASMTGAAVFMQIVRGGDMNAIRKALDEGIDPNQAGYTERPMNHAAWNGRIRLVDLLHEYGCTVDPVPDVNGNPLGVAADSGDINMTEHLLALGADPNASTTIECWALATAAEHCNIKIFDTLLEAGADVTAFDGYAMCAAIRGGEKMVNHLLPHLPSADRAKILSCALQYAARLVNLEMCKLLIKSGAGVNFTGGAFGTALQATVCSNYPDDAAASNARLAIFELLLSHGAEIRDVEEYPCILVTALTALTAHRIKYAQRLLDSGANVNGEGNHKYGSPLQAAAWFAPSLLEPLIAAGADVNATGGQFGTALQISAYSHDCRGIAILLSHGADINATSQKYGGVIQAAAKRDSESTGEYLAEEASVRAMTLLYDRGASVTAGGGKYGNALHMAAKSGNFEGVKWLISRGASVTAKGRWGTALDAAVKKKRWRIVSYLEQMYGKT